MAMRDYGSERPREEARSTESCMDVDMDMGTAYSVSSRARTRPGRQRNRGRRNVPVPRVPTNLVGTRRAIAQLDAQLRVLEAERAALVEWFGKLQTARRPDYPTTEQAQALRNAVRVLGVEPVGARWTFEGARQVQAAPDELGAGVSVDPHPGAILIECQAPPRYAGLVSSDPLCDPELAWSFSVDDAHAFASIISATGARVLEVEFNEHLVVITIEPAERAPGPGLDDPSDSRVSAAIVPDTRQRDAPLPESPGSPRAY